MKTKDIQSRKELPSSRRSEIKLRDYLRVLLSHRWMVILGFLLVLCATILYLKKATPVYQAETTLMREQESSPAISLFEKVSPISTTPPIESQQRLLKSRLILTEVAKKMKANGFFLSEDDIQEDISLSAAGTSADVLTITAEADNPKKAMMLANITAEVYIEKTAEMKSQKLTRASEFLKEQMGETNKKLQTAEEALNTFREREGIVDFSQEEGSSSLLKTLGDLYTQLNQTQMEEELTKAQLDTALKLAEEKKKEIKPHIQNQTVSKIEKLQSMVSEWEVQLAAKKQRFTDKNEEVISLKENINAAKGQLEKEFQTLLNEQGGFLENPLSQWQGFINEAQQLEIQLRGLQQKEEILQKKIANFKEEHPQLVSKQVELTRLERQARLHEQTYMMLMDKYEETRILQQMKGAEITVIDRATEPDSPVKPNKRIVLTLGIMIGLLVGVSGAFFLEYIDDSLKTEKDIADFLQLSVVGVVPKVEPEKDTLKAIEREIKQSFLEERKQHSLPSSGEGNPVLSGEEDSEQSEGEAGRTGKKRRGKDYEKKLANLRSKMLTNLPKRSPVIESFRTLRTNIKFAGVDEEIKTILVTSPGPMEGKSLTVANLAACLALSKVRTLIIDTDLRRPRLHAMFGQDKEPGLSDLLTDEKLDLEEWGDELINNEFIRKTEIDNLYLLPRGTRPPNPTELLGSQRLRQLMEKLREQFDIIIFDSPPLVAVTDATVIASELADTALLVVEAGATKRELGIRAKELLEKVDANIFGVVLNNLDYTKRYGSYYYYYYYHYHYYYSQEEEE